MTSEEKARERTKAWYRANKEKSLAWHKEYRQRKKEQVKAMKADYYSRNREEIRAKQNAKNAANPELAYQRVMAWRKANPEKYKELYTRGMNKRRAQKITTQVGVVDYPLIKKRSQGLCGICKLPITDKFEYDHVIPLSKGGAHTTDNHQLTHPSCNRKKSNNIISDGQ